MTSRPGGYAAIVLTGGLARRMGWVEKTGLPVGGVPLLRRVLASVSDASEIVIAGPAPEPAAAPPIETFPANVRWAPERPANGGPLAGIAAAIAHVRAPLVVVLAGDMPFTAGLPSALLAALAGFDRTEPAVDAVIPVDADGHDQPLAGAYRVAALRRALAAAGDPRDRPVRSVLRSLRVVRSPPSGVPDGSLIDVDTEADLVAAQDRVTGDAPPPPAGTGAAV